MRILFQSDVDYNKKPAKTFVEFCHDVGDNTGNLMFANAIQHALSSNETFTRRLNWEQVPEFIWKEKIDVLVINCANWLRPRYLNFLKSINKAITQIDVPVIMIGLGTNLSLSEYQDKSYKSLRKIDQTVKELTHNVERTRGKIGVRGKFTQGYFKHLGVGKNVELTGCPSILQFPELNIDLLKLRSKTNNGAIAYSHNQILDAWGSHILNNSTAYFICQDWAAKYLLFPGELTRSEIRGVLALDANKLNLFKSRKIKIFTSIGGWLHWLNQNIDLYIGGRIHGGLVALHAGVPAMFYRHDSRLAEFIDLYKLPYFDEATDLDETIAILQGHDWTATNSRLNEMRDRIIDLFQQCGVELIKTARHLDRELPLEESAKLSRALSAWWIVPSFLRYRLIRVIISFFAFTRIQNSPG